MKPIKFPVLIILIILSSVCAKAQQEKSKITQQASFNKKRTTVSSLKITTLSTMPANRGIGEWGYRLMSYLHSAFELDTFIDINKRQAYGF